MSRKEGQSMPKRANGEGSWGERTINGKEYKFFSKIYSVDEKEKRKTFYAKKGRGDTKEIKRKIDAYEKELSKKKQNVPEDKKISVGTCVQNYVYYLHKKKGRKEVGVATKKSYMEMSELFRRQPESMIQLKEVKTRDIEIMLDRMAPYYAQATIEKLCVVLNISFQYAKKNNMIAQNPMDDLEKPDIADYKKPLSDSRNTEYLVPEDVELFYQEAMRKNNSGELVYGINAAIGVFIIYSGVRVGEAIGLNLSDLHNLDGEKAWFEIHRTRSKEKIYDNKENYHYEWIEKPPKNKASIRSVPFCNRALEAVKIALGKRDDLTGTSPVFVTKNGTFPERTNILKTIKRIEKNAGCSVTDAGTHKLRHSFGSYLLEKGFGKEVDIGLVSQLLGHSNIETTARIYIHYLDDRKFRAINLLN